MDKYFIGNKILLASKFMIVSVTNFVESVRICMRNTFTIEPVLRLVLYLTILRLL